MVNFVKPKVLCVLVVCCFAVVVFTDLSLNEYHRRVFSLKRPDVENASRKIAGSGKELNVNNMKISANVTCSQFKKNLVGNINVNLTRCISRIIDVPDYGLEIGGSWTPSACLPEKHTAIIIPFRDRHKNLACLLQFLIPILQKQQSHFRIFVAEQEGNGTFNKATAMNSAFLEANKMDNFSCVIFHDVDLVPENDRNIYTCVDSPRHMSVAIDARKYKLPYSSLVGGVLSMRTDHFRKVNGYSNMFWGWGGEDDDMDIRMKTVRLRLVRPSVLVARYKKLPHVKQHLSVAPERKTYLIKSSSKRLREDGLNTVRNNVTSVKLEPLYTHIMVNVGHPPKEAKTFDRFDRVRQIHTKL